MKKIQTLKKNYEFRKVLSNGKFYCGKYVIVYIRKNNLKNNVIGIAINSKLAKAVKRNRIKRLIRENYILLKNKINTGYNLVFLWNKNANIKDVTFEDIKKDLINIFKKSNLLK